MAHSLLQTRVLWPSDFHKSWRFLRCVSINFWSFCANHDVRTSRCVILFFFFFPFSDARSQAVGGQALPTASYGLLTRYVVMILQPTHARSSNGRVRAWPDSPSLRNWISRLHHMSVWCSALQIRYFVTPWSRKTRMESNIWTLFPNACSPMWHISHTCS